MQASHSEEIVEQIARAFHERYEYWAVKHGWSSQVGAAVRWKDVPEANKRTMRSTIKSLLDVSVIVPAEPCLGCGERAPEACSCQTETAA